MHIGVLTARLAIEPADSLKDKRQVVRSLLQHIRNRFNVSAAEVDDLDIWRRATVGIAVVSNEAKFVNQVLSQVVNHIEADLRAVLEDYTIEIIPFSGGDTAPEETDDDSANEAFTDWFMHDAKDAETSRR